MAGLDEVLRRLGDDPAFEDQLALDPRSALHGYALSAEDLTALAQHLEPATARLDDLDQRRSRAGFFALLSGALHPPDLR